MLLLFNPAGKTIIQKRGICYTVAFLGTRKLPCGEAALAEILDILNEVKPPLIFNGASPRKGGYFTTVISGISGGKFIIKEASLAEAFEILNTAEPDRLTVAGKSWLKERVTSQ